MDVEKETKDLAEKLGNGWDYKNLGRLNYGQNTHAIFKHDTMLIKQGDLWRIKSHAVEYIHDDPLVCIEKAKEVMKSRIETLQKEIDILND